MGMFDFMAGQPRTPTWDDVQRRRALAEALAVSGGTPSTFGEGLAALGSGIGAVLADRKATRMDAERAKEADAVFEAALSGVPQDNTPLAAALGQAFVAPASTTQPLADALAPPKPAYAITPGAAHGAASLYGGIRSSLSGTESGGKLTALNNEVGAGGVRGHGGRLQFGAARLKEAADAGIIPAMSPQQFAQMDDATQSAVENWHFADIDADARNMGLDQYIGQTVGGVTITPDAIRAMAHLGGIGGTAKFLKTGGRYNPADSFGTSLLDYAKKHGAASGGAMAPDAPTAPSFAPISIPAPPPVNVALIRAMNNPYLSPEQRQILGGIMAQQQANQITPYQAAQLQMAQQDQAMQAARFGLEMQQSAQPKPVEWDTREVNGGVVQVNPLTGETRQVVAPVPKGPDFRPATADEAARYGAQAGQFGPDGRFYPNDPPTGLAIETGPDGQVRVVQGAGAQGAAGKPFTEGQSKDIAFATRAEGALSTLDPISGKLADRGEIAAGWLPFGLSKGAQSDEFQVARAAADEFLQAILRKDTGAAITADEQALYGQTYLPQPGDSVAVLAHKSQARRRAVEALKAGMTPAAIVAQERALNASGSASLPDEAPQGWTEIGNGVKIRKKN